MKKTLAFLGAASVFALSTAYAGTINGTVTNANGDYPLADAEVTVQETGRKVTTQRDGSFRLTGLPAGEYTLMISYVGGANEMVSVTLDSDADTENLVIAYGADFETEDQIVVIGQRGALNSALNQQKNADGVITVLSSDAVGQLPDENVAEAARRAAGVNVLNDQGEGRFISIRGLDPSLNSTSLNGVRVPSPEADARQVPLDVIDSDLLKNIIITKTLTPDMDGDSIGGNIEIETLSGLDQNDMLFKTKLGTVYSNIQEEYGEKASATFANNYMDGKFGVAGSISWQNRPFGSENKENDGEAIEEGGLAYPEEFELRDYQVTRKRLSAALNLDYQLDDRNLVYLHTVYSEFQDQEFRSRIEVPYDDLDFDRAEGGVAYFEQDEFEVDRDLKDRKEKQNIYAIVAGGEHLFDRMVFDWSASYSHAEEKEPERLDTSFRAEFDEDLIWAVDVTDPSFPVLAFGDAATETAFYDASNYELDELERTNGITEDEEFTLQANLRRDVDFGRYPGYVKFGAKMSQRDKGYELDLEVWEPDFDVTLADATTMVDYGLDNFGPAVNPTGLRDLFFDRIDEWELNEIDTAINSNVSDYSANEDIYAAYVMGKVDIDKLRLIGGVRVEQTEFDATGNSVFLAEEDSEVNGVVQTEDTVIIEELSSEDSYTDFLPSFNARYEITPDFISRAGYYASIVRPNIGSVVPSVAIEQNDDNEVEAELGNPDLDRQKADNFDFTLEYYPGNKSVISGGIFYKTIEDYIVPVYVDGDLPDDADRLNGVPFVDNYDLSAVEEFQFTYAMNVDEATLFGIELNYQQALDMLPAPFDGFIIGANYTYVDGETTVDGRDQPLPQQSENVGNLIFGYDKGIFDLRLAMSYRDEYIDEYGLDGDPNRVILDHTQLDFSGKVRINDQFKYYLDLKNITDEPFKAVFRAEDGDYLSQYEEYGWSVQTGFTFTY
ncbi:TonB-dependent receptor [Parvularcula flava]|uniref:TonB-dependent receptor n=1 Tax=Aquisalinus luteolus TaxID=1566827 RepID=A0A8J3A1Q1_9PROT|nr:TonB-dependent receptor [Aquisalinus luteolus]NHK27779.1 TonB-dependent receptor [Aquisalinus luteolus]GGH96474.1 TonB-dependent receptor [Aquisalinus luteolus]